LGQYGDEENAYDLEKEGSELRLAEKLSASRVESVTEEEWENRHKIRALRGQGADVLSPE
jgi:hypothetical protein